MYENEKENENEKEKENEMCFKLDVAKVTSCLPLMPCSGTAPVAKQERELRFIYCISRIKDNTEFVCVEEECK